MTDTALVPVADDLAIAGQNRIENHPGIEYIYSYLRYGVVSIDGTAVASQNELVRVLNERFPDHKLYPTYITRLKKRIRRSDGGYMLKDGKICYADGDPVLPLPLRDALAAFIQIGFEQCLARPETIQAKDVVKAMDIWLRISGGFGDGNPVNDAWTELAKTGPKKIVAQRQKVTRVIAAETRTTETQQVEFDEHGNVVGADYVPHVIELSPDDYALAENESS